MYMIGDRNNGLRNIIVPVVDEINDAEKHLKTFRSSSGDQILPTE